MKTLLVAQIGAAHAGPATDIKASLGMSRQHTMTMLGEPDHAVLVMRTLRVGKAARASPRPRHFVGAHPCATSLTRAR